MSETHPQDVKPTGKISMMRWKILRDVVLKRVSDVTATSSNAVSVRRFRGFEIFRNVKMPHDFVPASADEHTDWYAYTFAALYSSKPAEDKLSEDSENVMYVRQLVELPKATDLIGFDNTGNVCVWPAEEVLALYCVQNASHLFNQDSVVLELGGGMTCLAGLSIARFVECARVHLTDGNERSIKNLNEMVRVNRQRTSLKTLNVEARTLRWDALEESFHNSCDVIICADCLFYDAFRETLALCIAKLLKDGGVALLMAPKRGHTMNDFVRLFEDGTVNRALFARHEAQLNTTFRVKVTERYSDHVWAQHTRLLEQNDPLYDADIHYPYLISVLKVTSREQVHGVIGTES